MAFDFRLITGPSDSKQENFSSICSRLIMRLYPDAKPVDGKGGDEGLDTYIGIFNGQCRAFQHKYFIDKVGTAQRKQIEASLQQAIGCHQLIEWILMVPKDLNPAEIKWFDGLKNRHNPLPLDWWGKTKLQDLISAHNDIALDYQPPPSIILLITEENIDKRTLTVSRLAKLLRQATGKSVSAELQQDLLTGIVKDIRESISLRTLIWGPGQQGSSLYIKRHEIRDVLHKLGHTADFSEEIWRPQALSQSGLNLSVADLLHAKTYDYIVCLMSSIGSISEIHELAKSPKLAHKMLICVDSDYREGNRIGGVLRVFEGHHGKLDWFDNPSDLEECHLATRVIDQVCKVAEAKEWEIARGSS
jgi:hypothetical protein